MTFVALSTPPAEPTYLVLMSIVVNHLRRGPTWICVATVTGSGADQASEAEFQRTVNALLNHPWMQDMANPTTRQPEAADGGL